MFAVARLLADLAPHRTREMMLRIVIPAVALAVLVLSPTELRTLLQGPGEDVFETLSVGLVLLGVVLRLASFGFTGVPATRLTTHGAFSVLRHPVLLSDALIAAGIIIGTQVVWFIALGLVLLTVFFRLAVAVRDEEMARALGAIIAAWRAETPAVLPDLAHWNAGGGRFSLRKAVACSTPALFVSVALLTAMEIAHDLTIGHASWTFWPADWDYYLAALAASFMLVAIEQAMSRMMKDSTSARC